MAGNRDKSRRDPRDEFEVLSERIRLLENEVRRMRASMPTTVHAIDTEEYLDPVQGETAIHHPSSELAVYHDGAWQFPGQASQMPMVRIGANGPGSNNAVKIQESIAIGGTRSIEYLLWPNDTTSPTVAYLYDYQDSTKQVFDVTFSNLTVGGHSQKPLGIKKKGIYLCLGRFGWLNSSGKVHLHADGHAGGAGDPFYVMDHSRYYFGSEAFGSSDVLPVTAWSIFRVYDENLVVWPNMRTSQSGTEKFSDNAYMTVIQLSKNPLQAVPMELIELVIP